MKSDEIETIVCVRVEGTNEIIPLSELSQEQQNEVLEKLRTENLPNAIDKLMEPHGYRRRGKVY